MLLSDDALPTRPVPEDDPHNDDPRRDRSPRLSRPLPIRVPGTARSEGIPRRAGTDLHGLWWKKSKKKIHQSAQ